MIIERQGLAIFTRTTEHEREETPRGTIRGVLATDGEASDGHILSIAGLEAAPGIPLLFGHDDFSGERHLGSWTAFRKTMRSKAGESRMVGEAEIELEGAGANREFREDVAVMIGKGHVRGFSVRWEPIEKPVPRVNLPSNHPAFIDAQGERSPAKRWGLFFPRSRALEGSVVSIGADREALIERAGTDSPTRELWRSAVANMARHERDTELEVMQRSALLELFPTVGVLPGASAATAQPDRVELEAIDSIISRHFRDSAERLLAGMPEEIERLAKERFAKLTGR